MEKNKKIETKKGISRLGFSCPYCYAKHTLDSLLLKCPNISCDNIVSFEKYDFVKVKNPKKCLKCKKAELEIRCPNENYGFSSGIEGVLPHDIFTLRPVSIGILGDRESGKNCYVSSLLIALRHTFPRFFTGELTNADERSARLFKECYYNPLENESSLPVEKKGINDDVFPICYTLRLKDTKTSDTTGIVNINYSSTNSELILSVEEDEELTPYEKGFVSDHVTNSDVLFLTIDPLSIPYVRKLVLARAEKLNEREAIERCCPESEYSPKDIIRAVTKILDPTGDAKPKQINKKLAIIFTKLDIIEKYYVPMSGSNRLHIESRHLEMRSYNRHEHKIASEAVIDLLVRHMGDEAVLDLRKFKSYGFFAVSSIGATPSEDGKIPQGAVRKRVLDPFLWALAEYGLIDKSW